MALVEDGEEQSPNTQVLPVNTDEPSIADLHGTAAQLRTGIGSGGITIVQRQRSYDRAAAIARLVRECHL